MQGLKSIHLYLLFTSELTQRRCLQLVKIMFISADAARP